ncbi:hypothetical protein F5148DRAFT_1278914 [Russula earlei]|uniref:Uncharacterized protein n=1 Tax=Russula earlei TaxID=71964 RepID=A0ACC0UNC5_9AGAM|nr:hypothetical protein F5148DRAFT_1278914 [Russula earlei]
MSPPSSSLMRLPKRQDTTLLVSPTHPIANITSRTTLVSVQPTSSAGSASGTPGPISVSIPGVLPPPPPASSSTSSTNSRTSLQPPASSFIPSSAASNATTSFSPTSSPVASSSALSTTPPPPLPVVTTTSDSGGTTFITSTLTAQSSQSPTQTPIPASRASTSFLKNKPAMITVFSLAGLIVLALLFVLLTMVVRRSKRNRLENQAIDFSPTGAHLVDVDVDVYNDGGGGSDNDDDKRSGSSLPHGSGSGSSSRELLSDRAGGAGAAPRTLMPAPAPPILDPAPMPLRPPREMQQQATGTGFIGIGTAYGDPSYPYYDPGRQRRQHSDQQQKLPPPPIQRRRQQEEEWLPQPDLQSEVVHHPASLVPAIRRDPSAMQTSNVPFATPLGNTTLPGAVGGGASERRGSRWRDQEYTAAPLTRPLRIPSKLGRGGESSEDVSSTNSEDSRRYPRVLKVAFALSS